MSKKREREKELSRLREQVADIDEEILHQLSLRLAICDRIGKLKAKLRLDVNCPEVEQRKLTELVELAKQAEPPLDPVTVHTVFEAIIAESRRRQTGLTAK